MTCSIGIDFGDIWIAKVGIRGNNQFTLVGNSVNIAAQLVEIAPEGAILIGHAVYNGIPQSDRELCKGLTHVDWSWKYSSNNSPYPFYQYRGCWQEYPL